MLTTQGMEGLSMTIGTTLASHFEDLAVKDRCAMILLHDMERRLPERALHDTWRPVPWTQRGFFHLLFKPASMYIINLYFGHNLHPNREGAGHWTKTDIGA